MPPTTDINVAMKAKFAQSNDLEIAIGIKSTSVGIGKKIDSIKLKKPKIFFDLKKRSFSFNEDIIILNPQALEQIAHRQLLFLITHF